MNIEEKDSELIITITINKLTKDEIIQMIIDYVKYKYPEYDIDHIDFIE